jgi:hypothetical protein
MSRQLPIDATTASLRAGPADPLGTIPLFDITAPPAPARVASPRHDALAILAGLAGISDRRRDLDQHEHDLIVAARDAGATWQQIAASLGFSHRQAAQQRHRSLARLINAGNSAGPLEDVTQSLTSRRQTAIPSRTRT